MLRKLFYTSALISALVYLNPVDFFYGERTSRASGIEQRPRAEYKGPQTVTSKSNRNASRTPKRTKARRLGREQRER